MAFVGIRLNFVGFTVCRTKRKKKKKLVQGINWGGLLPISSLGSRHCNGVVTGRALCA